MTADLYPLQVLLVTLAGWVNRHQQHVIEYLVEENRSLKGHPRPCRGLSPGPAEGKDGGSSSCTLQGSRTRRSVPGL